MGNAIEICRFFRFLPKQRPDLPLIAGKIPFIAIGLHQSGTCVMIEAEVRE